MFLYIFSGNALYGKTIKKRKTHKCKICHRRENDTVRQRPVVAHGLVVDNIVVFVRYEPVPCFQKFTEEVAATRRKAGSDKAGTAAGNTAKLIAKLNI